MRRFCCVTRVVSPNTSKFPTINKVSDTKTLPVTSITFDPFSSIKNFVPTSRVCTGFAFAIPTEPTVTKLVFAF